MAKKHIDNTKTLFAVYSLPTLPFRPHWIIQRAMENPNTMIKTIHEEPNYIYHGKVIYDTGTKELKCYGNVAIACPYRHNHHIGSTCRCCGQKD